MLARLFNKSSTSDKRSANGGTVKQGRRSNRQRQKLIDDVERKEDVERRGRLLQKMDEEHFASGMPDSHLSMSDKLDSHRAGNLFKYAAITNPPSTERAGMLAKIRHFKPSPKIQTLTLNELPAIRLVGDANDFRLSSVLSQFMNKGVLDYVLIDCILIHFIPLDSFANDKSIVTVQLNDFRKTHQTTVRSAKLDNTMGYNLLFCLDYCVETRDVDKMTLSFACPNKEFQEGVSWGAVKLVVQLQFLGFPKRLALVETMGVCLLSDTDLDDFQCDPRDLDLVLTPNAIQGMRSLKKRGEIENLTLAKNDEQQMITAKTILGEDFGDQNVEDSIGKLKEIALIKERQNSGNSAPKPVLKSVIPPTISKTDDVSSDELNPEDSMSNLDSNVSFDVKKLRELDTKKIVKFIG